MAVPQRDMRRGEVVRRRGERPSVLRPKSASLTALSLRVTSTLEDFMSRWRMPAACTCLSAATNCSSRRGGTLVRWYVCKLVS